MPPRTPSKTSAKTPFTLEAARAEVLTKIAAKAAAGVGSPFSAKAKEPKRSLYEQALAELEAERAIFVDRSKAKPKYFLIEFAPTVAGAAGKMEQFAARKHPALLTATQLKKALSAIELPLFTEAFDLLETSRRVLRLVRGKSVVFAHGDSLRAMLGASASPVSADSVRRSYTELVRLTGFPDVEIAALHRQAGLPMPALKDWLLREHREGRANFGLGDWSLAGDATRAGVIELRGDRYLLVRLEM